MKMTPTIRKFALTMHISVSAGWLGAVLTYLVLTLIIRTSTEVQIARASYLLMDTLVWYVLIPLAFSSLLTGLLMSLGTSWGLLKHYWVLFKLLFTVFATIALLLFTQTISSMSEAAVDLTVPIEDLRAMEVGLNHAAGALVILIIIMFLSVFKPQGLTRYGWQKQQENRQKS